MITRLPRAIPLLFVALCALLALPGNALAAQPTFHDKFNVVEENVDICGVIGTVHAKGSQIITLTDTTFTATGQVTVVFTTSDGRTAVISNAGTVTNTFVDNGDGTITIIDSFVGLPEKISSRGAGGVVLRDAGVISFLTTIDLDTGDVTTEVVQHGPHPEADSDFTIFCDSFLDALG